MARISSRYFSMDAYRSACVCPHFPPRCRENITALRKPAWKFVRGGMVVFHIIWFLSLLPWQFPSTSMEISTYFHGSNSTSMEASTYLHGSKVTSMEMSMEVKFTHESKFVSMEISTEVYSTNFHGSKSTSMEASTNFHGS